VTYESPENALKVVFTFNVTNSFVDVECVLNRFVVSDPQFLALVHKPAFDLAQAAVGLVSFSTGIGFTLVFDSLVSPDGNKSLFRSEDRALASLCNSFSPASGFAEVMRIVMGEFSLCIALNELIEAITLTHHAPASCARCIERLRTVMSPGMDRKHAWVRFRSNLQISREYLDFITDHATGARHGDPAHVPGSATSDITRRSWIIMDRFLEYRKRGNTPLPLSEFPLL